jgi:Cell division protein CrgA
MSAELSRFGSLSVVRTGGAVRYTVVAATTLQEAAVTAPETPPNPASIYTQATEKPPSGPWLGALTSGFVFFGAAWILVYTLFSVPFVEALGAWNYVGVAGTIVLVTLLGKAWRGAPYVRPTHTSRV